MFSFVLRSYNFHGVGYASMYEYVLYLIYDPNMNDSSVTADIGTLEKFTSSFRTQNDFHPLFADRY
jgi:hypothetical protein